MKFFVTFAALLLIGAVYAAPATNEPINDDDETIEIDKDIFDDAFKVYSAQHDIVEITVPLNDLTDVDNAVLFFVEADIKDGKKQYQGLYVSNNGTIKKLLDNGQTSIASTKENKEAYFGASDGLYSYNAKENKAEKYGTITENIIGIAKNNKSDELYILNNKNKLYKVTENGNKKELIVNSPVQQIVIDYSNNLYYIDENKNVVVLDVGKQNHTIVEGLPKAPHYISLVKPPFFFEDSIAVVVNNQSYTVFVNGTVEKKDFVIKDHPTAYGMEAVVFQYYAYDKNLYEYNLVALLLSDLVEELKSFFEENENAIKDVASKAKHAR